MGVEQEAHRPTSRSGPPRTSRWSSGRATPERFVDRICERLGRDGTITVGRVNETQLSGERQVVDAGTLRLLAELTGDDRSLLSWLMEAGLLERRSPAQLDEEFARTCERLNFELRP